MLSPEITTYLHQVKENIWFIGGAVLSVFVVFRAFRLMRTALFGSRVGAGGRRAAVVASFLSSCGSSHSLPVIVPHAEIPAFRSLSVQASECRDFAVFPFGDFP